MTAPPAMQAVGIKAVLCCCCGYELLCVNCAFFVKEGLLSSLFMVLFLLQHSQKAANYQGLIQRLIYFTYFKIQGSLFLLPYLPVAFILTLYKCDCDRTVKSDYRNVLLVGCHMRKKNTNQ